ncbi:MAG TPA: hypothetical protein PLV07_13380 [Acidiphilium sp.]|nr:hypothetical protein [Acidiphilium sp.]
MKFRKKPIVIEACQWWKNGDHPADYAHDEQGLQNGEITVFSGEYCKSQGWEGQIVRYFRRPDVVGDRRCLHCGRIMHEHGWIDTLEGGHIVCPGDWIITGVNGEHYPCKPDIFTQTYEDAAKALLDEGALVEAIGQAIQDEMRPSDGWIESEAARFAKDMSRAALDAIRPHIAALQARVEAAEAENARLREALEKLARLGNGDHYGNSIGNEIARAALGDKS